MQTVVVQIKCSDTACACLALNPMPFAMTHVAVTPVIGVVPPWAVSGVVQELQDVPFHFESSSIVDDAPRWLLLLPVDS